MSIVTSCTRLQVSVTDPELLCLVHHNFHIIRDDAGLTSLTVGVNLERVRDDAGGAVRQSEESRRRGHTVRVEEARQGWRLAHPLVQGGRHALRREIGQSAQECPGAQLLHGDRLAKGVNTEVEERERQRHG